MIIAIPLNDNVFTSSIGQSFGRSPYFLIHNDETGENEFLENKSGVDPGGAGVAAAQLLVDRQVDILITPRCGGKAIEVIDAAKIKVYKTINSSLRENLEAYKTGKLSLLDEIHGLGGR